MYCSEPECINLAARNGKCWAHARRQAKGPLQERLSPVQRLCESAIQYANAEDDDEYRRAKDRLYQAARNVSRKRR